MVLSLLLQINEESSVKGKTGSELDIALVNMLQDHKSKLRERQNQVQDRIEAMIVEDNKKITSDNIREGWSSGVSSRETNSPYLLLNTSISVYLQHITKESEEPIAPPKAISTKSKKKETTIETLNAPSSSSAGAITTKGTSDLSPDSDAEDEEEELPTLLPSMQGLAKLRFSLPDLPLTAAALPSNFSPSRDVKREPFDEALKYLSSYKELLREDFNTTDALLVEAFQAQMRGEGKLARRCVEKALLVQYCNKLGKDGVNLFFRR